MACGSVLLFQSASVTASRFVQNKIQHPAAAPVPFLLPQVRHHHVVLAASLL
jgi:hypothetical protein